MGKKDPTKPGVVYIVTDINEPERVRYVGRTVTGLKNRVQKHWWDSRKLKTPFSNWLRSRSDRRHEVDFRVVSEHPNVAELNQAEKDAIAYYRSIGQADLNLADGGDGGLGVPWDEERRRKQAENTPRGENHYHRVLNWSVVRSLRERAVKEYVNAAEEGRNHGVCVASMTEMLRNETWHDPEYDPSQRVPRPMSGEKAGNARLTQAQVDEIRRTRQERYETNQKTAERYGVTRDMVWRIIKNVNWHDPNFDPSTIKSRGMKK